MDEARLNARTLSSLSAVLPGKGLFAPWFTVFAASTIIGLFFAAQMHYSGAAFGRPVSWGQALYWGLGDWYEWAILSPFIFFLGHRFRFEWRRWRRSFGIHFIAAVLVSIVHLIFCGLTEQLQAWVEGRHIPFGASFQRLFANRFHFNMAVYGLILCAINAWSYYRQYREREAQAAELAGRLARAQLQALRSQLNPHFLFNTLHAISSLMLKDVYAANRMLTRLGELLRLSLDTTDQQEVPLRQELEFLKRYVEIEEIRFGDRLAVQMSIEPGTLDAVVPNLLLQPLVENAIRYAVEPNIGPAQVQLSSARRNGQLILQVSDNGPGHGSGEPETDSPVVPREGIGLSNTRQRLQQLYGEKQSLALNRVSGGLLVSISIPFYTKAEPALSG